MELFFSSSCQNSTLYCYLCSLVFSYGYLSNTKVKFIMVTTDLDVRDTDVRSVGICFVCFFCHVPPIASSIILLRRIFCVSSPLRLSLQFFRKFHAAYVDAVSNPFHVPGKKITSRTFGESVGNIVRSYTFNWSYHWRRLCNLPSVMTYDGSFNKMPFSLLIT